MPQRPPHTFSASFRVSALNSGEWIIRFFLFVMVHLVSDCTHFAQCPKLLVRIKSLWLFLTNPKISFTNNEAERRLRGFVIQRKIGYGTTSDAGDKFRDRLHSRIETCEKRQISSLDILTRIVAVVITKQHIHQCVRTQRNEFLR